MNILKTCRKAGHIWSRPDAAAGDHFWVEIRRCLRRGCVRFRAEDDTGRVTTYDIRYDAAPDVSFVVNVVVVERARRVLP